MMMADLTLQNTRHGSTVSLSKIAWGNLLRRNSMFCSGLSRVCAAVVSVAALSFLAPRSERSLANEPNLTEAQKIDFMQHAKVVDSKRSKKGMSNAWDLTLSDGTLTHRASFQPVHEAKPVAQFADGRTEINFKDFWEYNIAGYRIAKLLGLDDMVPVYTERKWNGMAGSISWWVPDVQFDEADRRKQDVQVPSALLEEWNKQMYKVRLMRELFCDTDTNLTNLLVTKDWRIWRIDFSRAFRLSHDLQDPKDLVQCDRQAFTKLRELRYDQMLDATKPYLAKDDVKALIARRDKIVAYIEKLIAQRGEGAVLY